MCLQIENLKLEFFTSSRVKHCSFFATIRKSFAKIVSLRKRNECRVWAYISCIYTLQTSRIYKNTNHLHFIGFLWCFEFMVQIVDLCQTFFIEKLKILQAFVSMWVSECSTQWKFGQINRIICISWSFEICWIYLKFWTIFNQRNILNYDLLK